MIVDYSRYETDDIIKIQAFVRGALCRVRVEKMVEKWIDELLVKLGRPTTMRKSRVSVTAEMLGMKNVGNNTGDVSSRNGSRRQLSIRSVSTSNDKRESFSGQGSVGSIRSIFESKRDLGSSSPAKSLSTRKLDSKEEKEEKEEDQKQTPTIEKPKSAKVEKKDSEDPTTSSYVKNIKLVSNATNNVSSSEKVLEEQEKRMNEEIQQLLKDIRRLGEPGKPTVHFGVLFDDEKVSNYYEALVGTLKAAKKKKLITYEGQYLLKGMTDEVVITIV